MTEITDAIRAGVLGAISRGMSLDYAARADGIRVTEAEAIARTAGWPDDPLAVLAEHRRLTGIPAEGKPVQDLIGPPGVDTRRARAQPLRQAPRRPQGPRPDLSVARVRAEGLRIEQHAEVRRVGNEVEMVDLIEELTEYCAEVAEVIDAITPEETEQALAKVLDGAYTNPYRLDVDQAEREYRGGVVQAGPIPEHLEPLADYVARVGSHEVPVIGPLVSAGPDEIPQPDAVTSATPPSPMPAEYYGRHTDDDPAEAEPLVWDRTELIEEEPLPPATDTPAPASVKRSATRPGTLPCEVCGRGVALAYIERTGRQRHGHHPEGS